MTIEGLSNVAMGTGSATVLAQAIPLPDGWSNWPATAIMGFVTLAALGLLALKLKQDTAQQSKNADAITALSVSIQASTDAQRAAADQTELVAQAMMQRPCLVDKAK